MNNPAPKDQEDNTAAFYYPISKITHLSKPSKPSYSNFYDLARARRSSTRLCKLFNGQLDTLLWYSAKVIGANHQENGYILSHRPSSSAGARHPIDIVIVTPSESKALHYYNPFEHTLNELVLDFELVVEFLSHINESVEISKATVVWFVIHIDRTSAKYENPESLIWRDVGTLLQMIQLTASAMKLGSCPIGTLAEPHISKLFDSSNIISGGGIIIGNHLDF